MYPKAIAYHFISRRKESIAAIIKHVYNKKSLCTNQSIYSHEGGPFRCLLVRNGAYVDSYPTANVGHVQYSFPAGLPDELALIILQSFLGAPSASQCDSPINPHSFPAQHRLFLSYLLYFLMSPNALVLVDVSENMAVIDSNVGANSIRLSSNPFLSPTTTSSETLPSLPTRDVDPFAVGIGLDENPPLPPPPSVVPSGLRRGLAIPSRVSVITLGFSFPKVLAEQGVARPRWKMFKRELESFAFMSVSQYLTVIASNMAVAHFFGPIAGQSLATGFPRSMLTRNQGVLSVGTCKNTGSMRTSFTLIEAER